MPNEILDYQPAVCVIERCIRATLIKRSLISNVGMQASRPVPLNETKVGRTVSGCWKQQRHYADTTLFKTRFKWLLYTAWWALYKNTPLF